MEARRSLARLGVLDRLAVVRDVLLPTVMQGTLARRTAVVGLAERYQWDARAVARLKALRAKFGDGPVVIRVLTRKQVILLKAEHVDRVLRETPEPFATASAEKVSALGHFEPRNSLISRGNERACRRRLSDDALQSDRPVHACGAHFAEIAAAEIRTLVVDHAHTGKRLTWDRFSPVWDRIVRRVVLGDGAAPDTKLSEMLLALRHHGNWGFLRPRSKRLFRDYADALAHHLQRRESGSLAAMLRHNVHDPVSAPPDQYTHYMFAFDAAALAVYRALAVLATEPDLAARAATGADGDVTDLQRGCVLESLRLWPTTLVILRETTRAVAWEGGEMPKGWGVWIFSSLFHRDDESLPYAHQFSPDIWSNDAVPKPGIVPFSDGPGICPGRHIVQHVAGAAIGSALRAADFKLFNPERLSRGGRLAMSLDHTSLEFQVMPR